MIFLNVLGPISIDYTFIHCIYIFNVFVMKKGEICCPLVLSFCMHSCSCKMAWWWPLLEVETSCQVINNWNGVCCAWLQASIYMWVLHQWGCFV